MPGNTVLLSLNTNLQSVYSDGSNCTDSCVSSLSGIFIIQSILLQPPKDTLNTLYCMRSSVSIGIGVPFLFILSRDSINAFLSGSLPLIEYVLLRFPQASLKMLSRILVFFPYSLLMESDALAD